MMMNFEKLKHEVMKTNTYVYRCNQLQQLLPGPISKWLKVLSQPWEGDVTMVLPSTYSQIKKAVTNPSKRDLQIACLQVPYTTPLCCRNTVLLWCTHMLHAASVLGCTGTQLPC